MRILRLFATALVMLSPSLQSTAATITTPEIIARTTSASFSCLRLTPVGLCLWLDCSIFGCSVRSSLKIGHYNPDLVVSSYNALGQNPWLEIRQTLGLAQTTAANGILGRLLPVPVESHGNRTEGSTIRRDHKNLLFRETDAIGHPQFAFSSLFADLLCNSQARAYFPYFQSAIDALAWRQEIPEIFYPASLIPGLREIGQWPLQTWGGVYPRTGWTMQPEEPKGAAINVQRAGDIVTRSAQPHIYVPLTGPRTRSQRVWPPGALFENDPATGTWQMLLPKADTTCHVFGIDDRLSASGWGGGRVDAGGDYVFNLWRPYQCCQRRGDWFLTDINWASFP